MAYARLPLTAVERTEYDDLLRQVVGDDPAPKATAALADELLDALRSAEQAHRTWATRAIEHATRAGLKSMLRSWIRSRSSVLYRTPDGSVVGMSRRAGVKRSGAYQQVMFEQLTPAEARAYLNSIEAQLIAIGARFTSLARLVDLVERHPDARTVAEALAAEDTSIDVVLGAAA